ncbi:MAG: 16S rRNA (adenine(1518)-N(6)/adenine(1519)-N(6)) -dimethyltransferase RsmA [Ignavibacteriaceae bacterium]
MKNIIPLKRLGQHFLQDPNILRKIILELNPVGGENIVEIGPGTGTLTEKLIERVPDLTVIEIDSRATDMLGSKFPGLKIINEDFLKVNLNLLQKHPEDKIRIVGNIPYNLTSPIIFRLINERKKISDAVFLVQYEVARRMTAQKGSKDYGILAVLLRIFAEVRLCFKVSPNVFLPKPKVHSAVVHIYFNKAQFEGKFEKLLISLVKAAFGKRRKTLKNSLASSIFKELNFTDCGIDLSLRAEQLDPGQFLELAYFVSEKTSTE